MPSKQRPARPAKGGGTPGPGSASSGGGPAAGGPAGNAAAQDAMKQDPTRYVGDDGAGLTLESAQDQLGEIDGRFAELMGVVQGAHAAQAAGDPEPWFAAADDPAVDLLTYFLPAGGGHYTLAGQFEDELAEDPSAGSDLYFAIVQMQVDAAATRVSGMRQQVAKALVPHSIHGKTVSLPTPDLGSQDFHGAVGAVVETYGSLVSAGQTARFIAQTGAGVTGKDARDFAVSLLAGPLAYDVRSQEFAYVYAAFLAGAPSKALISQVDVLTGREDHTSYFDEWFGEDDDHAMLDGLQGSATAGNGWTASAPMVGPSQHAAQSSPGATRASGSAPGVPEAAGDASTETQLTKVKGSASAAPGAAGAGASVSGERTAKGGRDKAVGGVEANVKAGDKISGNVKVEGGVASHGDRDAVKVSAGGGRTEDGRAYGDFGTSTTETDRQGTKTTKTGAIKGGDGMAGASGSTTVTKADGTSSTNSAGGSLDTKEGKLSAEASTVQKDADGEVTGGASASGSVTVKDGTVGGAGKVGVQGKDGKKLELSADVTSTVGAPEQRADGRWQITITYAMNAGFSAGKEKGLGDGTKAGGSGGISGKDLGSRTRIFDSQKEADAFYANPDRGVVVRTVEDALKMKVGETASQEAGIAGKLDGSLKVGPATVGAGVTGEASSFSKLERREGDKVRVEVGSKAMKGIHGSASMAGVGGGIGHSRDSSESTTVDFDLKDPMGRRAFEIWQKTGQLPLTGGFEVVGDSQSAAKTNHRSLSILGMSMSGSRTTGESVTNLDGQRTETNWGTEATAVSIPGLGSYSKSHSLTGWQVNEGDNLYQTESVVKGSDLDDVKKGLSRSMTGDAHHTGASDKGSNKGTYRLQAAISEKQMDEMIDRVVSGRTKGWEDQTESLDGFRAIPDLEKALRAAGNDRDAQRRALAAWTSRHGAGAMDVIHNYTGGADLPYPSGNLDMGTQFHVAVEGNEHLTGLKGQLDLELRMKAWDEKLAGGERGPQITGAVKKSLDAQRNKLVYLEECGELPPEVHAQEYNRTKKNIGMLDALLLRSLEPGQGAPPNPAVDAQLALVHKAAERVAFERAATQEEYETVYARRRIHLDGRASYAGKYKPAKQKGAKDFYDQVEKIFEEGANSRELAMDAESRAGQVDLARADLVGVAALNFKAAAEYRRARSKFAVANRNYANAAEEMIAQGGEVMFRHAGDPNVSLLPGQ